MICETCTYWACDSKDMQISFIFGHHPRCPNFILDRNYFMERLGIYVDRQSDKKLLTRLPELVTAPPKEEDIKSYRLSSIITKKLYTNLSSRYFPIASNCYIYKWESDVLAISNLTKRISEFEVKISRNDFKADSRKDNKHTVISDVYNYKFSRDDVPNYFYYVIPPGLLDKSEIPAYAGLIEVGINVRFVKKAPLLHKLEVSDDMENKLLRKIYYKYWK